MTFQPLLPFSGNSGWTFLTRTREVQEQAFENSSTQRRKTEYFLENIGKVTTADELVADRRLLEVALGAFGLEEDIGNKFFVEKVLSEGTIDDKAFANRLADRRYFEMAEAFGFDLAPPNIVLSDFADGIVERFKSRQFEVAVGAQDGNLRLALGFERELEGLLTKNRSEDTAWFTIMGTPPLRAVFEGALGLPPQVGALDLDQQLSVFKEKSLVTFGTSNPNEFASPEQREALVRKFLLRSELAAAPTSLGGASVALSLLQSAPLSL